MMGHDVSGAWISILCTMSIYAFTWCWHRCLQAKAVHVHWKEDCLLWDEYGIQLQFPSTQSEVHIEGTVGVLSLDDDNHIFPEESELVSAVYNISANEQFPQPVTVKLYTAQHSNCWQCE